MKVIYKNKCDVVYSDRSISAGFSTEANISLISGKEYVVHAMSLWKKIIFVLLSDEYDLPNWYPIEIFQISSPIINALWQFKFVHQEDCLLKAIWGYHEIVLYESHYSDLIERVPSAMQIFNNVVRLTTTNTATDPSA